MERMTNAGDAADEQDVFTPPCIVSISDLNRGEVSHVTQRVLETQICVLQGILPDTFIILMEIVRGAVLYRWYKSARILSHGYWQRIIMGFSRACLFFHSFQRRPGFRYHHNLIRCGVSSRYNESLSIKTYTRLWCQMIARRCL
jgi:hypothetical protein